MKIPKVVLDPVMVAKGGAKLINDQAIAILRNASLQFR
ncbi:bifunctional hydroxymethylpyrimidine kinase/phosphomethylpyrimidine kinase [Chryseobacterium cucumeris]